MLNTISSLDSETNRALTQRSVLVVGSDRLATEAMAAAIDPIGVRTVPVHTAEAVSRIEAGGVQVVVLLPRGIDPTLLLATLRRNRRTHLVIAASGLPTPPPEFPGLRPAMASTLEEVTKQVDQFVSLSTDLALTNRHVDILQRLAVGDTPTEAATNLGITVKTLNNHLGVIYRRLGTRNVTQAVLTALRGGLVRL
jgi:DNA-binding NarL/FixJ family response regulator